MMNDIFDEMKQLQRDMDKMFRRVYNSTALLPHSGGGELMKLGDFRTPSVNVREKDDTVVVDIELPGAKKEDIDLSIDENSVEVKSESKMETENKKKSGYTYESRKNTFYRRFELPSKIKADAAKAEYKNGILHIDAPKLEKTKKQKMLKIT